MNRVAIGTSLAFFLTSALWPSHQLPPRARWGELPIRGRIGEISISPTGHVWLTTALGEAATSDSALGDWRMATIPFTADSTGWSHPSIDRITFFNADTAIATGYLRSTPDGKTDQVLRTLDSGRTWTWVSMGVEQWIYDAFVDSQGRAWIGGSHGDLRFSTDFGATWRVISKPFDPSKRLASVWMTSATHGYAGALADELRETLDGGRSWKRLKTPRGEGRTPPDPKRREDGRIDQIRAFGPWLVIRQDGLAWARRRDGGAWHLLPDSVTRFEIAPALERLVGVTRTRRVISFDSTLANPSPLGQLATAPIALAVRGAEVLVLDDGHGIAVLSAEGQRYGFPLSSTIRQTEMYRVRTDGQRWFGTTAHHIYQTQDSARSWTRIGTSPALIEDFLIRDDGQLLVYNHHGGNQVFDPASTILAPAPGLDSLDIVGIVPRNGAWIAYGGRQRESAGRVDVARTFFPGQFRGSTDYGHVSLSEDGGRTWKAIDRWNEGGVAAVAPTPSGAIYALSHLGSIRRLVPAGGGYRGENLVQASEQNRDSVPYVQNVFVFHFPNDDEGIVVGDIHHLGLRLHRTSDGGRRWRQVDPRELVYNQMLPVDGGWVGSTGSRLDFLGDPARVVLTVDCGEDPDWVTSMGEGVTGGCIRDVSSAGPGQVLVEIHRGRFERNPAVVEYRLVRIR